MEQKVCSLSYQLKMFYLAFVLLELVSQLLLLELALFPVALASYLAVVLELSTLDSLLALLPNYQATIPLGLSHKPYITALLSFHKSQGVEPIMVSVY